MKLYYPNCFKGTSQVLRGYYYSIQLCGYYFRYSLKELQSFFKYPSGNSNQ